MEIARYWRLNTQRYNMTGSICTNCGKPYFSPRPVCDACQKESVITAENNQPIAVAVTEPAHR